MKVKGSFLLFLMLTSSISVTGQKADLFKPDFSSPPVIPGMTLVWNDEFNIDGKPDPASIGVNGGDPSGVTFPVTYEVNWVRVYQIENQNNPK